MPARQIKVFSSFNFSNTLSTSAKCAIAQVAYADSWTFYKKTEFSLWTSVHEKATSHRLAHTWGKLRNGMDCSSPSCSQPRSDTLRLTSVWPCKGLHCMDAIVQMTTNWNEVFVVCSKVEARNFTTLVYSVLFNVSKSVLKMTETFWKNGLINAKDVWIIHINVVVIAIKFSQKKFRLYFSTARRAFQYVLCCSQTLFLNEKMFRLIICF
jgi:hypothetical protein